MVRAKQIQDGCCFDSSPRSTFRVLREKLHSGLRGPWWEACANAPWVFLYRPTNYWGVRMGFADWSPRADGLVLLR
jgi:hypothetical protein